jgi:AT hook motif.
MQKSNLYFTIFQKISEHLTILLNIQSKKKAGRPPKVSDLQLTSHPTFQTLLFLHLPDF